MVDERKNVSNDRPAAGAGNGLDATAAAAVEVHGGQALLVAQFAGIDDARAAYEGLRQAEREGSLEIDGVLVVKADQHGAIHVQEMTDHTTRRGFRWGVVAGTAIGLLFPPSILVGAVVAGVAGAAVGKAYGVAKRDAVAQELAEVIAPGTSGLVALVAIDAADAVRAAIPQAVIIRSTPIDDATAETLRAGARDASGASPS